MIAARKEYDALPGTRSFDGGAVWFITSGKWKKPDQWIAKEKPPKEKPVKRMKSLSDLEKEGAINLGS